MEKNDNDNKEYSSENSSADVSEAEDTAANDIIEDDAEMFGIEDVMADDDELFDDESDDGFDSDYNDEYYDESYDEDYENDYEDDNSIFVQYAEKERQHKNRTKTIISAVAGVLALIIFGTIFYFSDTGIIGAYKANFAKNYQKIFPKIEQSVDIGVTEKTSGSQEYVDDEDKTQVRAYERTADRVKIVPFESASSGGFEAYRDGLVCVRTNYMCFINSTGAAEWEQKTTVVNPMLSVDGRYIAIAAENGTKLCLYEGENLIFETDTENDIKSVRVSAGGDIVLVCDKANYKGAIVVYNKDGQEIFAWSSGQNNILSADISSASRRVAASLLNVDKNAYSIMKVFDINSKTNSVDMAFDDTILFKVDYTGDTITGFGDNSLVCMTSTGRVISDKRFDMVDITHYAFDNTGNKLIHFDSANIPVFHVYSKKGALDHEIIIDDASECIDINGDYILYNSGRDVMLRKAGSDRIKAYTATMDILKLILIDNNVYAVLHSNSIEIVRI